MLRTCLVLNPPLCQRSPKKKNQHIYTHTYVFIYTYIYIYQYKGLAHTIREAEKSQDLQSEGLRTRRANSINARPGPKSED